MPREAGTEKKVLSNKNAVNSSDTEPVITRNEGEKAFEVVANKNVAGEDVVDICVASPTPSSLKKRSKRVAYKRVRTMIRYIRQTRKRKEYYQNKDVEMMKQEHARVEEEHSHENCLVSNIQSLVFGGVDGIITSFAVVAAIAGAGYSTFYILAIGIANLVGDAFSMGLGDYLSSDSEIKFIKKELKREEWEYDNYREGEESEMVDIFMGRGMSREDAETVIKTTAKYKDVFCNDMMIHELGLTPPSDEDSPLKKGCMTFAAFLVCGIVPLLAYMFVDIHSSSGDTNFYISVGMTAAALFLLGVLKSMASYVSWYRSGFSIMVLGCIAAGAAYGISALAEFAVASKMECYTADCGNGTTTS